MYIREFLPFTVLIVVLAASVVGCASSFRFNDRAASTSHLKGWQRGSARTDVAEASARKASDAQKSVSAVPAVVMAETDPHDQQSAPPPSGPLPLTGGHIPADEGNVNTGPRARLDDDCSSDLFPSPAGQSGGDSRPETRPPRPGPLADVLADVLADHTNYYSRRNLTMLSIGVGVAACIANTPLDETLRRNYQEDIRDLGTDEVAEAIHAPEVLGNGAITIPVFCGAALLGSCSDNRPLGRVSSEWGRRCLRTTLVGGPPMLAMQMVTGASRPGETDDGSRWRSFNDNNGVSGHSFMGAVPFLSAAKMAKKPLLKAAFYAGSTLAAFSRINDDDHYASQAMLGWWMAYVAAAAVDETQRRDLAVFPYPVADGIGVGFEYRR